MLGHRTLNAEDYFDILKRRKWLIALPLVLLPIIAVAVTYFIPARYVSQTLVLIEEQKVPDEYVKPVISSDLDSRLSSMKEQILSRSRLQPIIERYNLYASSHAGMEERVDMARKAISIRPIRSEIARAGGLPGFFISFTASDPHSAQLVCGEITSLFLSENLKSREASTEGTTDFLESQLQDAKRSLDEHDAKLAAFQRQYGGRLPTDTESNSNMLASVNTQLEAATQSLSRIEQDRTYAETMLSQQVTVSQPPPSVSGGQSYSQIGTAAQQQELATLEATESDLLGHYTADYPDVTAVRRKISDLKRQMQPVTYRANGTPVSGNARESSAVQQLRAQIRSLDSAIEGKKREQAQILSNVRMYQERISGSPLVQQQYAELNRDNDTAQAQYKDLLTKLTQAKQASNLERRQQGEQFRIMDEPNLPDAPTFPNKMIFGAGGLAGGLAIGLIIAAFLEYKDTSLRTERDIWAFTKLPTLAVIAYAEPSTGSRFRMPKLPNFLKKSQPTNS